jgi:hypothetical protein
MMRHCVALGRRRSDDKPGSQECACSLGIQSVPPFLERSAALPLVGLHVVGVFSSLLRHIAIRLVRGSLQRQQHEIVLKIAAPPFVGIREPMNVTAAML